MQISGFWVIPFTLELRWLQSPNLSHVFAILRVKRALIVWKRYPIAACDFNDERQNRRNLKKAHFESSSSCWYQPLVLPFSSNWKSCEVFSRFIVEHIASKLPIVFIVIRVNRLIQIFSIVLMFKLVICQLEWAPKRIWWSPFIGINVKYVKYLF